MNGDRIIVESASGGTPMNEDRIVIDLARKIMEMAYEDGIEIEPKEALEIVGQMLEAIEMEIQTRI